jgi:hypothetical protein
MLREPMARRLAAHRLGRRPPPSPARRYLVFVPGHRLEPRLSLGTRGDCLGRRISAHWPPYVNLDAAAFGERDSEPTGRARLNLEKAPPPRQSVDSRFRWVPLTDFFHWAWWPSCSATLRGPPACGRITPRRWVRSEPTTIGWYGRRLRSVAATSFQWQATRSLLLSRRCRWPLPPRRRLREVCRSSRSPALL